MDTSDRLPAELTAAHTRAGGAPDAVRPLRRDLRHALPEAAPAGSVSAIACLGDTLPHLPAEADVTRLPHEVARALRPGGHFVATYRDLTPELRGADRFLPVRSTDDRGLTCFLEYTDEDTVQVHDLLHTRTETVWELRAGSCPKLRIAAPWLAERCADAGLWRSGRTGPGRGACASCTPSGPDPAGPPPLPRRVMANSRRATGRWCARRVAGGPREGGRGMRESGSAGGRQRRVPYGAIGLCLALALSIAGIAWTAGLDESGVEVAPPGGAGTFPPATTPAPAPSPHPAGLPGPSPRSRPQ
ncbi:hypothetical protein MUU72_19295 [Streptomyces sp. RS10V-4]|uniref:hypothetical protein n=1 Tax=Streptomyces rhizoryzae TaxID=2932493 RepID=UPI0020040013|nr:hypothetical protein [Streptomyces rhizoryzae]MCK7625225.1 hypothetical protein [Streptomyces rhizoryzae]